MVRAYSGHMSSVCCRVQPERGKTFIMARLYRTVTVSRASIPGSFRVCSSKQAYTRAHTLRLEQFVQRRASLASILCPIIPLRPDKHTFELWDSPDDASILHCASAQLIIPELY